MASLNQGALGEQLYATFWDTLLPADEGQNGLAKIFSVRPLLAPFMALTEDTSSPGRLILDACTLTILGRRNSDPSLVFNGMRMYGKAMRQHSKLLQYSDVRTMLSPLLASCRFMCLYEMMRPSPEHGISTQGEDWHKHAGALHTMFASMDPNDPQTKLLYREVQLIVSRMNFSLRREQGSLEWFESGMKADPKDEHDLALRLRQLMAMVPRLLADVDHLLWLDTHLKTDHDRASLKKALDDLLGRFNALEADLVDWKEKVITASGNERQDSVTHDRNVQSRFTESKLSWISQRNGYGLIAAANEYWVTRLVITFQTGYLVGRLDDEQSSTSHYDHDRIWVFLRCIATTAPLLLKPEAGVYMSELAFHPLCTAIHTLAGIGAIDSKEFAMTKESMTKAKGIAFTNGFFKSISAFSSREGAKGDADDREDAIRMGLRWYG